MPGETIESFVAKLQAEGVEAGKRAADKLKADAQEQAERIIEDAKAQAEKIVADANAEAEKALARSKTELGLAARDTALELRESLSEAMSAILAEAAKEKLSDADFLGSVMRELIVLYATQDLFQKSEMRINVNPAMHEKLVKWALQRLGEEVSQAGHPSIDLTGSLSEVGFEYEISGATIEFTLDSVVEKLREMVSPSLREALEKAMAEEKAGE